jgi:hypothetical protein
VGALDPEPVKDRNRISDPHRHRIGRGIMALAAAAVTAVIREDHAEALARKRIGQQPLAQVVDRAGKAVVKDHGGAIAARCDSGRTRWR